MPLNLDNPAGEGGGQFYDKLRFNAQGGVWYLKTQDGEKRFSNGFKAVFDMQTLQTGWSKFNGSYLEFIPDPSLSQPAPQPPSEDDERWKRSFKVLAFSKDAFGGTVEFTHSARTVTGAFNLLYSDYEKQNGGGKLPVVEVSGDPAKEGDYYAPKWSIAKMIDRPSELPSVGGAAPEPQAAPASDDEEF